MQRGKKTKRRKVHRQVKDRLFRFLIYLAEEYQKVVEQAEESIFGTKQISLPTPQCVSLTRRYIAEGQTMQDALNTAVNYCINHGILSDFLRKYRAEVLGMLLEEFDVDKYERSLKNEGIEIGIQQGTKIGIQQGAERINRLNCILIEQNRISDLKRATQDMVYQEQLFREFDL